MKLSSILFYEKTNDNENMFLILSTTTTTTTKYESIFPYLPQMFGCYQH